MYTWGAYINLNGTNTVNTPTGNISYLDVLKSQFMSFDLPFMLDTTPPNVIADYSPSNPINTDNIVINAQANDVLSGVTNIKIFVDGTERESCDFASVNDGVCNSDIGTYPEGAIINYYITAVDAAGNIITSPNYNITVAGAPSLSFTGPSTGIPISCSTPNSAILSQSSAVGGAGNGTLQTVKKVGDYLYTGASAASSDNFGLYIYDVSDETNITQLSFFSTHNPDSVRNSTWGNQVLGIDVVGDYAYLATYYGGLVIVDVTNPNSPTFAGKIPLFNLNAPGARESWDVKVIGNYAYLAAGRGMIVVDVSDKANPTVVSNLDLGGGDASQVITISGNYAFVAMRSSGVRIVDISNPVNPIALTTITADFNASNWAYDVEVDGSYLYVANHFAGNIRIYDVSDLLSPILVSTVDVPGSNKPRTLNITGGVLYVGSDYEGAYVFDISNPTNPTLVYQFTDPPLPGSAIIWDVIPLEINDFTKLILISEDTLVGVYITETSCDPPADLPDLVAVIPGVSVSTVAPGGSITFTTNDIVNVGTADAPPYSIAGFFIDNNNDGFADYTATAPGVSSNTPPGASSSVSVVWNVPADALPGDYRIGYIVNDPESFSEATRVNNWSGWSPSFAVIVPPTSDPDLVPDAATTYSGSLVVGNSVTFTNSARNTGADMDPAQTFKNKFRYNLDGGPWSDVSEFTVNGILAGATSPNNTSATFSLTNSGTLGIEYCVDSGNDITETDEDNNCRTDSFTIVPAPSANISGIECDVPLGGSTCDGELTWDIQDASTPNVHNSTTNSLVSSDPSGSNQVTSLELGSNTFQARDDVSVLASVTLNVDCVSPYVPLGGLCSEPPPPPPEIDVTADRYLIRSGDTVNLNIEVTAVYPTTCEVYGANLPRTPVDTITHDGTISPTNTYSLVTRPLKNTQIINVECSPDPAILGVDSSNDETRIEVVPTITEI